MPYQINGQGKEGVSGALSQGALTVHDALRKAHQMLKVGMEKVTIKDGAGNQITGDDLKACCEGTKALSDDLKAN